MQQGVGMEQVGMMPTLIFLQPWYPRQNLLRFGLQMELIFQVIPDPLRSFFRLILQCTVDLMEPKMPGPKKLQVQILRFCLEILGCRMIVQIMFTMWLYRLMDQFSVDSK